MKRTFLILFTAILFSGNASGQPMDREVWQKITQESSFDYSPNQVEKSKETVHSKHSNKNVTWQDSTSNRSLDLGPMIQIILIAFFVFILVLILISIIRNVKHSKSIKTFSDDNFDIDILDEEVLEKSYLENWLEKSLLANNCKLAIRIYFLITLRRLEELHLIKWEKRKTNWNYIQELSSTAYQEHFKQLVKCYDNIWYGEKTYPNEYLQNKIEDFKKFNHSIH